MKTIIVAFGLLLFSPIAFSATNGLQLLEKNCNSLRSTKHRPQYYSMDIEYAPGRYIVRACKIQTIMGPYHFVLIQNKPKPRTGVSYAVEAEDLKPQIRLANTITDQKVLLQVLSQMNGKSTAAVSEPTAPFIADSTPASPKLLPAARTNDKSTSTDGSASAAI